MVRDTDHGTQYRSIAFYRNDNEKAEIENYIKQLQPNYQSAHGSTGNATIYILGSRRLSSKLYRTQPQGGYVQHVSIPEIKHFKKLYPSMVKADHLY